MNMTTHLRPFHHALQRSVFLEGSLVLGIERSLALRDIGVVDLGSGQLTRNFEYDI